MSRMFSLPAFRAAFVLSAISICSLGCNPSGDPSPSAGLEQTQGRDGDLTQTFAAGSLVISMDTASQDSATLLGYGLVDSLLRGGVTVNVVVQSGKTAQAADLTGASGHDFANVASTFTGKSYSAAPFVIDSTQAAAATPIITAWRATYAQTKVDVLTASLTGYVQRTLTAAPRLAIEATGGLDGGYELNAFNYLNAAHIPDSQGNVWPSAAQTTYTSPDILTTTQIAGTHTGGTVDGALFNSANQSPNFCALAVMHDDVESDETVREVRQFLTAQPTQAFFECTSVTTYENNANYGHFLTTGGVADDSGILVYASLLATFGINLDVNTGDVLTGAPQVVLSTIGLAGPPTGVTNVVPDSGFTQWASTFQPASGEVESIGLANQLLANPSAYKGTANPILIQSNNITVVVGQTNYTKGVLISGRLDATAGNGRVVWLSGHAYTTAVPISTNPSTNGARLFLEQLYQSPCTGGDGAPTLTTTITTPTLMPSKLSTFTYTITETNSGPGWAQNVVVSLPLPTNVVFSSATGGGAVSNAIVTWPSTSLAANASVTYTVTVTVNVDGTYTLTPSTKYKQGNTQKTASGGFATLIRDTVPPLTTIVTKPPSVTNQTTATFTFTANEAATFMCKLDAGAYASCVSGLSYSSLAAGSHTFTVQATDTAGNVEVSPPAYTWTVDLTPPVVTLTGEPANPTKQTSGNFTFTVNKPGSTFSCSLDGAVYAACTSPYAFGPLLAGPHVFKIKATDPAGNISTIVEYDWTIDLTPPVVTILTEPPSITNSLNAMFTFTSNKTGSIYHCQLDTGGYALCTSPFSIAVTAGTHIFYVYATDPAGNDGQPASYQWTVDSTPPSVSILTGPSSPTNQTTETWTFTSNKGATSFQCSFDGAAYAPCTSPLTSGPFTAGRHVLLVISIDTAGNTSTAAEWDWTIDLTPPTTTITQAPPAQTNQTTASLAFTSNESGSSFMCSLDSAAYAACTSPITFTNIPVGSHTFQVYAIDLAGNVDMTGASVSWAVSTQQPITVILSGPPNPTHEQNATFTFNANEQGVTFTCQLDNGGYLPCTSPWVINGPIPEGPHIFYIIAVDTYGNTEQNAVTYNWTIDITPPQATISSAPAQLTDSTSATFTFDSNEPGSTFLCQLNGSGFTSCTTPLSYQGLAPGQYTFQVEAVDLAGNVSQPASYSWTIDTTGPVITFTGGPASPTNVIDVTFTFTSNKGGTTFMCQLDDGGYVPCSSPWEIDGPFIEGPHIFYVIGKDPAGNNSQVSEYDFTIDTTPAVTTITQEPASTTSHTSATFAFTANEQASFNCSIDGAAYTACTSPITYAGLTAGTHTFAVYSVDLAGNVEQPGPGYQWTVDTTLPETIFDSGPASPSNAITVTFAFHASESGGSFVCYLDEVETEAACTSPFTTNAAEGSHRFYVIFTDDGGNTEPSPAEFDFVIDRTPPDTSISSGPPSLTNSTSAVIVFASTESNSTFQCSLDGATAAACTSPKSYTSLSSGQHTFTVAAIDLAGNIDPSPASTTWTIDTAPPANTTLTENITSPTRQTTVIFTFTNTDTTVTFQCKLDLQNWIACSSPLSIGPLSAGGHKFLVRAVDPTGNIEVNPPEFDWTIDLTTPVTTLQPIPSPTNTTSETFIFSSSESNSTFRCQVDSAAQVSCASPFVVSGFAPGSHTFIVFATDAAGNSDTTGASVTWIVDSIPPNVTIRTGPASPTKQLSATFTFGADKLGSTFKCKLDTDGAYAVCASPLTVNGLVPGQRALFVIATDPAGNISAPAEWDWLIDVTPPDTTLSGVPPNPTDVTTATLTFTSSKSGGGFACSIDGSPVMQCYSPTVLTNLADGQHTFEVAAVDDAGNVDPTPAMGTWTVDTILPITTITSAPDSETTDTSATFTFTVDKADYTEACSLDGAGYLECASPVQYTDLELGSHTLHLRATDSAGNVEAAPATFTWNVVSILSDGGTTPDGGTTDGGNTDGGTTDGGHSDGGTTDGGTTDGGNTDGGTTDGGTVTPTDGGLANQFQGGGCTQTPVSSLLPIFGMLYLLKRRRRSANHA